MDVLRGDIFYIPKLGRTTGSEQTQGRPAVIVSNDVGNNNSSIVEVVYLTTQEKNPLPTHTKVLCHVPSIALCEQISTVSKERLGNFIRACSEKEMADIDRAIMVSLGLKDSVPNNESQNDLVIDALKKQLEDAKMQLELKECGGQEQSMTMDLNTIKAETERDLYKGLYEQLLQKMIG